LSIPPAVVAVVPSRVISPRGDHATVGARKAGLLNKVADDRIFLNIPAALAGHVRAWTRLTDTNDGHYPAV
jgi:hypothetical protein